MVERRLVQRSEAVAVAERAVGPALVVPPRRALLDPVHDRPQRVDPVDRSVARVPDEADAPPGRSTRASSAKARSASNQWNACATVTASSDAVAEGQRLGGAGDARRRRGATRCRSSRIPSTGSTASRRRRVGDEQRGELAGAGGEVAARHARARAAVLDEPRDRVGRVRGAGPVVGVGARVEAALRDVVDGHVRCCHVMASLAARTIVRASVLRSSRAALRRGGRTPACRVRPSGRPAGPRRRRPGACTASSRSTRTRVVQRVLGQPAVARVARDVGVGPRRDRVDLHEAASDVVGDDRRARPCRRLVAAQARSSRPPCRESAVASGSTLRAPQQASGSSSQRSSGSTSGSTIAEVEVVALPNLLDVPERLGEVVLGVEEHDLDARVRPATRGR